MSQQTSTSETIVALYLALKERGSCETCGGSGTNWVGIGNGTEVDAEPCECAEIAWYVLEKYKEKFENNAIIYMAEHHIAPSYVKSETNNALMAELFSDVR